MLHNNSQIIVRSSNHRLLQPQELYLPSFPHHLVSGYFILYMRNALLVALGGSMARKDKTRAYSWPLMRFRTGYPQIWYFGILFQVEGMWKVAGAGRTFWLSPETGHKGLMWEVPSLHPEERSILASEDTVMHRGVWMTGLS